MLPNSNAIVLPGLLRHQIDGLAQKLLQPNGTADFFAPAGEPALVPADSVSWRIFKNPVSLFIGGITAVLLEFGEPRVRDGVWQHSGFRTDPLKRLQRTGLAAMTTVYGPATRASAMIAGVVRRHDLVKGRTTEGEAYHANDPVLLDWVQATAGYGFMEAYHVYVGKLTRAERAALFIEALPAARLYGATGAPASQEMFDALLESMRSRLVFSPVIDEFLNIMKRAPLLPAPARPLQRTLVKAAVDILPAWVRARLQLGSAWSLNPVERTLVRTMARAGDRLILPSSPAVQSCRRLGLPDAYLYREPPPR